MRRISPAAVISILCLWVLCLSIGACSKKPAPGPLRQYRIEGEILKTSPSDQTATIKHTEIKGWMGAMTMDYPIRSKDDFSKLHPGDHIIGTVFVQDEDFSVGDIKKQ